jgi:hypothetical protein
MGSDGARLTAIGATALYHPATAASDRPELCRCTLHKQQPSGEGDLPHL